MNNNNKILNLLEENINNSNENKSSHWKNYLNNSADYKNIYKGLGFGNYTKKNYKKIYHSFLQKIIFDKKIFLSDTFHKYKKVYDIINRQIDTDTIRHIFTFELLKNKVNPRNVCIIGDGKINGIVGINLIFQNAKIFSCNLSETLINDYLILNKTNLEIKNSIKVILSENDNIDDNQLFLIPSNFKKFLLNKKIDLFINIASFQEMVFSEIEKYFEIIKNNKSILYSCNREYKKLIGGEELYFDKYPWGGVGKRLFFQDCPWHQKYYSSKFPFVHKYDGNIKHCLIDYS